MDSYRVEIDNRAKREMSTGLAARLAGVPRSAFIFLLSRYGLSPFGQSPDELEDDLANARSASHPQ